MAKGTLLEKAKRWVCFACGGVWHVEQALARGRCPSCSGEGAVRDCYVDPAGVVTPIVIQEDA